MEQLQEEIKAHLVSHDSPLLIASYANIYLGICGHVHFCCFYAYWCYQVELESAKIACTNAQLECNAADERAKLLASEVIGLEEKVVNFLFILGSSLSIVPIFP